MFEEKLESAFEKLAQQINSQEDTGIRLSDIGYSTEARRLGEEVTKLVEFSTKTAFLFFSL